ncbi:Hypothetical predicted protein, partial [Prunus dulcis]
GLAELLLSNLTLLGTDLSSLSLESLTLLILDMNPAFPHLDLQLGGDEPSRLFCC